MKAKKTVPGKNEQLNPLPTPSDQEGRDKLSPWQKEIVALAEARLSDMDERSVISHMLRRAIGMSRIVEDMALAEPGDRLSMSALAEVMQSIQEDIYVAKWISGGKDLFPEAF
jgi:hypothetical protein